VKSKEIDNLCRELSSSIRDLNIRLNELSRIKENPTVNQRMCRLLDTRFKLIQTLMDITSTNRNTVFSSVRTDYMDFSRKIR